MKTFCKYKVWANELTGFFDRDCVLAGVKLKELFQILPQHNSTFKTNAFVEAL